MLGCWLSAIWSGIFKKHLEPKRLVDMHVSRAFWEHPCVINIFFSSLFGFSICHLCCVHSCASGNTSTLLFGSQGTQTIFTNDFWPRAGSRMGGARRDFDHFNEVHQHRKLPYYDVLGVRPDATTSEIIRAYRDLVDCFLNNIFSFFFDVVGMDKLTSLWEILVGVLALFWVFFERHEDSLLFNVVLSPAPGRLSLKLHPATWLNCGG